MTWTELKARIEAMDKEQANTDVTVYVTDNDEYYPLYGSELDFYPVNDVLDKNHPFLLV